jgi:putative transcriptional regulator
VGEYMKNRIKDFRAKLNMTQQELADLVSVSSRTIISLEKGQYNPSVLLAYNIARVFQVSIEELFIFIEENENEK